MRVILESPRRKRIGRSGENRVILLGEARGNSKMARFARQFKVQSSKFKVQNGIVVVCAQLPLTGLAHSKTSF
jgi:hypothetical protein